MSFANIDGIRTRYWVIGDGPPLLLLSPMGFDAAISHRWFNRVWRGFKPVSALARDFQVVAFDRRDCGASGGRVETLSWSIYARHAKALLDHLGIESAFVLGACVGCAVALALGAQYPERCRSLLLHWPVGGFRWLARGRSAFDRHVAFAREWGLSGVAERARGSALFWDEPEAGPWASVLASDAAFSESFEMQDLGRYLDVVAESRDNLFSDLLPPGATGDQLMAMDLPAFIMSGDDALHSMSGAHALRELMPRAQLSPLAPRRQNAATIGHWVYESAGLLGKPAVAA